MRNHFCCFSIALLLSLSTAQAHAGESYSYPDDPIVAEVLGMQSKTKSPVEMQALKDAVGIRDSIITKFLIPSLQPSPGGRGKEQSVILDPQGDISM